MNVHPLIIHFPIALLTLYALLEVLSLANFGKREWLPHSKLLLLSLGFVGACAALVSGLLVAAGANPNPILSMHKLFAYSSSIIFGLILIGYLKQVPFLSDTRARITLAVLGLIAITITGALGGAMVYGGSSDPVIPIVLKLLGLS